MIHSSYHFADDNAGILACAIHNGHDIRPELLELTGVSEADRLREEDPFTGIFAQTFDNHIIVETSRFEIDLNRSPEMAIYQKPEDCWGLNARLSPIPASLLTCLQADYSEWYVVLRYQIERLLRHSDHLIVLDLHSYNHRRLGPGQEPEPQALNPDIIIGRSNLAASVYPSIEAFRSMLNGVHLLDRQLDCRCDVKFSGGHLSRWINHNFPGRVICLAIEFKKIWMDEWTGKPIDPDFYQLRSFFNERATLWAKQYLTTIKESKSLS